MSSNPAIRWSLFVAAIVMLSATSFAQLSIAITLAPPPLPVYEQPVCPGDGYIWTPGYWAYDEDYDDYYWVPGTWVMAPEVGYFWTPPYWGWNGASFVFYDGYWGPEVGFYGGVNYGFGYFGTGFVGGRWESGHFFYNRAVMNVNETNIRNVYVENVTNVTVNHVSYNGGNGGIAARPTPQQEAYSHARHVPPAQAQTQQVQAARGDQQLRASVNQGRPAIAATPKPGEFKGNVVAAREAGGTYHPAANGIRAASGTNGRPAPNNARPVENNPRPTAENNPRPGENNARPAENNSRPAEGNARQVVHPKDLPAAERPPAPNTGNSKLDQKYQQQQDKMMAQQDKQRQKLQQQQENEHAQQQKQQANEAKQQQLEQRHQQQTSQLQQRQAQQMQRIQQKQQPAMHAQAAPAQPEKKPPHQ